MKSIVIGGTHSGVGKTCVAIGLMAAFRRRGLRVQPFKVGPDFLDPMHHKAASGRESLNLDGWMLSREVNLQCFLRNAEDTDLAIVEGVMGLFDGRDGVSETGSTAEMAKILGAPVILVLDAGAMARSAAAMVHGYTSFDPELQIAGVIFNKVGGMAHLKWLQDAVKGSNVVAKVLGGLPNTAGLEVPERHLGLCMPGEDNMPDGLIDKLADLMEECIDLDAILEQAAVSGPLQRSMSGELLDSGGTEDDHEDREDAEEEEEMGEGAGVPLPLGMGKLVRIGVARDSAFCFYYHENLALLRDAGAELVFFSPMYDGLPPRLDAIYLGGGYPELHGKQLTENTRMLYAMRAFAAAGGIIYGECGGLMYLSQGVEARDGQRYAMCGVFPFWTRMVSKMKLAYVTVMPKDNNSLFPPEVGEIRGQLYHFSEVVHPGDSVDNMGGLPETGFQMQCAGTDANPEEGGYMSGAVLASYVHLHFGSNPSAAHALVARCRDDTLKAAAVAAASASAVADSGPMAAAAAGAAAAAAVTEALGDPWSHGSDEEERDVWRLPVGSSSFTMPALSWDARRRSESYRWESRGSASPVGERGAGSNSLDWNLKEKAEGLGKPLFARNDSMPGKKSSNLAVAKGIRRSMSEYWGSLQNRRRGKRSSISGRAGSPDGRTGGSGVWDSPDSKTSSDEDVQSNGGGGRERPKANGHHGSSYRSMGGENERMFGTPSREFGKPPNGRDGSGVSFRIGDSGGKDEVRYRNGLEHGRTLSDDLDTQSSSDVGETWEGSAWKGPPSSPDEWGNVNKTRGQGDARNAPTLNVGLAGMEDNSISSFSGNVNRMQGNLSNGRLPFMASLDNPPVPVRIVSMLPSATEILMDLGVGDRLVGVSNLCDYPENVNKNRHVVSRSKIDTSTMSSKEVDALMRRLQERGESAFEIDAGLLRMIRPDLVFTQDTCARCDVDKHDVAKALAQADLIDSPDTEVVVLRPHTMSEVLDSIITVGEAIGLAARAFSLVEGLRKRLRQVARSIAGESRQRVLSLEGLYPPVLGGHWLPEMKVMAGGIDGLQEAGSPAEKVTWERVTAYAPEVLLLTPCSSSLQRSLLEVKYVANLPGFWSLPAVQMGQVFICEHSCFSRPGPRLVDGVEILARILHPSRIRTRLAPGVALRLVLEPGQRCRAEDLHKYFRPYQ